MATATDKASGDYNNIGEWLPPILEQKGLSVEALANAVSLTRAQIYNYLSDTNRPSEQAMIRICHFLGVPVEEGLRQYTPRKAGRRFGFKVGVQQLSTGAKRGKR